MDSAEEFHALPVALAFDRLRNEAADGFGPMPSKRGCSSPSLSDLVVATPATSPQVSSEAPAYSSSARLASEAMSIYHRR